MTRSIVERLRASDEPFDEDFARAMFNEAATLIETQAALLEEVEGVERRLRDQSDEPWPGLLETRVHYWRDKAIEAANTLAKLKERRDG